MNFEFVTELGFIEEGNLSFKRNSAAKPIHGTQASCFSANMKR
jgi:hypothetical protein